MGLSGHFIESSRGRILLTVHGRLDAGTVVLCLPPLFEEMNLSRAVIAKQAQSFAAAGLTTAILDYYGTGDSEGEIDQACAEIWLEDILAAGRWLVDRGAERIILWGVRFGGLMLLHFQNELHDQLPAGRQLLWKPVTGGKLLMSQFLRLKQTNAMLRGSTEKVNWRQRILDGETVEVAGYPLNGTLLRSIERLGVPDDFAPRSFIGWQELGATAIGPAIQRIVGDWPDTAYRLQALPGPAFWQVPETFSVPELYPQSLALLQEP